METCHRLRKQRSIGRSAVIRNVENGANYSMDSMQTQANLAVLQASEIVFLQPWRLSLDPKVHQGDTAGLHKGLRPWLDWSLLVTQTKLSPER